MALVKSQNSYSELKEKKFMKTKKDNLFQPCTKALTCFYLQSYRKLLHGMSPPHANGVLTLVVPTYIRDPAS
jgi:hypothetical protein